MLTPSPRCSPSLGLLAALAGAALLVGGCAGSASTTGAPGLPDGFPEHSSSEIRQRIVGATDTVDAFTAQARMTVRSPEQNRSFNAVIRQRRADSLFMRFSMFGVEGGRLLLTPDSVFFFDARSAELRVGPASAIREVVPVPAGSEALFDNMLGLLAPDDETSWTVSADTSLYYLTSTDDSVEKMTVDPTRWRVVRYTQAREAGNTTQVRLFSGFQQVEGILIPHQLIFRRPTEGLSATITYSEIDINPPNLSLELNVPPQVPRKPLQ